MTSPARTFLDGPRSLSVDIAERLIRRHQTNGPFGPRADLREVMVIVPGARSGRRLVDQLARAADALDLLLIPPRIHTPGSAIETFRLAWETASAATTPRLASTLERRSAWCRAIGRLTSGDRDRLGAGTQTTFGDWTLAGLLDDLQRELSGEMRSISEVAERLPNRRLAAAARAEDHYLAILAQHDRCDPFRRRSEALQLTPPAVGGPIDLVGLFDLPAVLRRYLLHWPGPVTAYVASSEDDSDAFDEFGTAIAQRWQARVVSIPDDAMTFVRNPESQALRVVECLEHWSTATGGNLVIEQVTVGLVDPAAGRSIERALANRGVNTRSAAGHSFSSTAPARLLATLRTLVSESSFDVLATLIRHPDVERWWSSACDDSHPEGRRSPEQRIAAFDRYRSDHLPSNWPVHDPTPPTLRAPLERLDSVLRPLIEAGDAKRPLTAWAAPIRRMLETFYSVRTLHSDRPQDRAMTDALATIRDTLDAVEELDPELSPRMGISDALAILNDAMNDTSIADPDHDPAVELLGWLELLIDDASHLVVASANEPGLPSPPSIDPFLPEPARRALGLNDHSRRYARDAAIASALQARAGAVHWIATRNDSEARPNLPSRLLLADEPEVIARRIARFCKSDEVGQRAVMPDGSLRFQVPEPIDPPVLERLRVTAFRDYLACPYRFYLRHVLKLDVADDRVTELEAGAFGTLIHDVLRRFGQAPEVRDSAHAAEITDYLLAELERIARDHYGTNPLPAVRIQLAGARQRLSAFADWQAHWRKQGYRIHASELATPDGVPYVVDGQPFLLTGTIDRIDIHENSDEIVILDYKTSESGDSPDKVHRKYALSPDPEQTDKRRRVRKWVDLQLPLYRHLAAALGHEGPLRLGYVLLPRDLSCTGESLTDWTKEDLDEADEVGASVVRSIRNLEYWPPAERPPAFTEAFSPICQDGLLIEGADEILNAPDHESTVRR